MLHCFVTLDDAFPLGGTHVIELAETIAHALLGLGRKLTEPGFAFESLLPVEEQEVHDGGSSTRKDEPDFERPGLGRSCFAVLGRGGLQVAPRWNASPNLDAVVERQNSTRRVRVQHKERLRRAHAPSHAGWTALRERLEGELA